MRRRIPSRQRGNHDHCPGNGVLRVTLDDLSADMNPDCKTGTYTVIKVTDSGPGVPLSIKDKIFEPFFTTKEIGKGTGLDLSTTLAIVKSHGGFITLYSEIGHGAQFSVYLPTVLTAAAAEEENQARQILLPRRRRTHPRRRR